MIGVLCATLSWTGVAAGAGPSAGSPVPAVDVALHLGRGDDGRLLIRSTVALVLPAQDAAIDRLLANVPGSDAYERALGTLRHRIGLETGATAVAASNAREFRSQPPTVRLDRDRAIVTFVRTWSQLRYPLRYRSEPASPPQWSVSTVRSHDVRFLARGPMRPRVIVHVSVRSDVGRIVACAPRPIHFDDQRATWTLRGGAPAVRVDLRPDRKLDEYLTESGDPIANMLTAVASGAAIPLVTLAWWWQVRRRRRIDVRRVRRYAWIGLGTAVAAALSWWAAEPLNHWFEHPLGDWGDAIFAGLLVFTVVPPALVFLALMLTPWSPRRPLPLRSRAVASTLVAAFVLLLSLCLLAIEPHAVNGSFSDPLPNRLQTEPLMVDVAACVFAATFIVAATVGLQRALWAALPTDRLRRTLYRRRWPVRGFTAVLALATLAQWYLIAHEVERAGGGVFGIDASATVRWIPFNVLNQSRDLIDALVLLVVAGLVVGLGADARETSSPRPRWTTVGVCIVFAGAVLGPYGAYGDLELPLSAIVGGGLLWLLCRRPPGSLGRIAVEGAASTLSPELAPDTRAALLDAALAHELDRIRERSIDDRRSRGEITAAEAHSALDELREPLPPSLGGLSYEETSELALSVGPTNAWSHNAVVAVRLGAKLMVPLLLYFAIVLYRRTDALVGVEGTPALSVVSQISVEIATWLGAAFTLGALYCCLPGRNGVLKGGVLALVCALASLVDVLVGDRPASDWVPRITEITVFLIVLGVWMDATALAGRRLRWRGLARLYRLRSMRVSAGYAVPLVLLTVTFGQQLVTGGVSAGIEQLLEAAPAMLQGGR